MAFPDLYVERIENILLWMADHGSSVLLNWGEDTGAWECSWMSGGKRATGVSKDLRSAIADAIRAAEIPNAADDDARPLTQAKRKETYMPKYPEITVQLTGEDGNAMFIIGRVRQALQRGGIAPEDIKAFSRDAMAGNYDHVLQTCLAWVNCE